MKLEAKARLLASSAPGIYAALILEKDSAAQLWDFVDSLGISPKVPASEYHCTVCYSRTPVDYSDILYPKSCRATPLRYELFTTKTEDRCLVLVLDCKEAESVHNQFMDKGARFDYPEYHPHITLAYPYVGEVPTELPQFSLLFHGCQFKDLNPNFTPRNS